MIRKGQFAGDGVQAMSFAGQFYVIAGPVRPVQAAAMLSTKNSALRLTTRQNPVASLSPVLSGCVRMSAAVYSHTQSVTLEMLVSVSHDRRSATRAELERRRQARCLRYRFRKNPKDYLAGLEETCDELNLPP